MKIVTYVIVIGVPVANDGDSKEERSDRESLLNHVGAVVDQDGECSYVRFTVGDCTTYCRWIENTCLTEIPIGPGLALPLAKYYESCSR